MFGRRAAPPEMAGATHIELLRRDVIAIFGWPGWERARDLAPLAAEWSQHELPPSTRIERCAT